MRNTALKVVSNEPTTIKNFLDLPGCEFTPTGLAIAPGLKREHWERIGGIIRQVGSGVQWWIGDWMSYGEKSYGDKSAQAVDVHDQTGINVDTLRYYQHVSEKVEVVRRLTTLSWSHHQAVAALKPKQQIAMLARAQAEGLSCRELRREVEKAERLKTFKIVDDVLQKILARIEDGCYTPEAVMKCNECGADMFGLGAEEIRLYMQQLVGAGKCEWRDQGGKKDEGRGGPVVLCVPKDMPAGSSLNLHRSRLEEGEEHY